MYMSVKQAAEKWGISDRRVRTLCTEGKIPGAFQEGRGWKIPIDAVKPTDGRYKSSESLLEMIDRKKANWIPDGHSRRARLHGLPRNSSLSTPTTPMQLKKIL